jgi:hypothetical protein
MFESEGDGKCGDCGGETWYHYSRGRTLGTVSKDAICMFCGLYEHEKAKQLKPGDNTTWKIVEHKKSHLSLEDVNSERSDRDMLPLQELCKVNESAINIAIWESEADEDLDN